MQINIHYDRLNGKPKMIFHEGLISDDGIRVKTHSIAAPDNQLGFSKQWWNEGFILHGKIIHTVTKYLFYYQWFDILELRTADGELLGHYSDTCTPLKKIGESEYALTDLFLDLWRFPDGSFKELDWDEYEDAIKNNLLTPELATQAKTTFHQLIHDAEHGRYPFAYLT